jgi:hypothetical protein
MLTILRHSISILFLPFLVVVVVPSCLLTAFYCQRQSLGQWLANHVVVPVCRWSVYNRRLRVVQLVRQFICASRSRNAGTVGSNSQYGNCWSVLFCPQPDDKWGSADADGPSLTLGILGGGHLGWHICLDQPRIFCAIRRARFGETVW